MTRAFSLLCQVVADRGRQPLHSGHDYGFRRLDPSLVLFLLLSACGGNPPSTLDPAGPAAAQIETLWWILFWISVIIFVIFAVLLAYAIFRRRYADESISDESNRRATRWVVIAGVAIPAVILVATFFIMLPIMRDLEAPDEPYAMTVEVVGELWWWRVFYSDSATGERFESANEIHIPVGRPVQIRLLSDNVIHSFWVPQLAGKQDMIPGRENTLWLQADEPGVFPGACAEFCGYQHTHMRFDVVAHPQPEFDAWLARAGGPAAQPTEPLARAGQQVFLDACAQCHGVRGTAEGGKFGPDLTRFASRRLLAGGAVPNTRGHLGGWISNPQVLKPGNKMPAVPLAPGELQALLAYLGTLR